MDLLADYSNGWDSVNPDGFSRITLIKPSLQEEQMRTVSAAFYLFEHQPRGWAPNSVSGECPDQRHALPCLNLPVSEEAFGQVLPYQGLYEPQTVPGIHLAKHQTACDSRQRPPPTTVAACMEATGTGIVSAKNRDALHGSDAGNLEKRMMQLLPGRGGGSASICSSAGSTLTRTDRSITQRLVR